MKPVQPPTRSAALQARLGLTILVFLIAASLPYLWLIENFGYDDILREPTAVILGDVQRGGSPLIAAWLAFAMASLSFIPVAFGFQRLLVAHGVDDRSVALLGIGSAIAQAVGLLRWVLVVPALAATFADPRVSPATREAVLVVFDAVHRYGGMVIGEMIGQLLLAGWTGGLAVLLWRSRVVPRWLSVVGASTVPLWLLGQTELLHPALPVLPSIEVTPLAFMVWEAWLLATAVVVLVGAWRQRKPRRGPALAH